MYNPLSQELTYALSEIKKTIREDGFGLVHLNKLALIEKAIAEIEHLTQTNEGLNEQIHEDEDEMVRVDTLPQSQPITFQIGERREVKHHSFSTMYGRGAVLSEYGKKFIHHEIFENFEVYSYSSYEELAVFARHYRGRLYYNVDWLLKDHGLSSRERAVVSRIVKQATRQEGEYIRVRVGVRYE